MATHSSVLAQRIPGTGEPDRLPSMGSHRVRHDWSDLAAAAVSICACGTKWNHNFHLYWLLSLLAHTCLFLKSNPQASFRVLARNFQVRSVQFSRSVVSNTLRPHRLHNARSPCPSLTPGACSNLCPLSQWCHPTISSSVVPFFSCLQSFPASGSLPMSQFFASGGQSIGASASASVLPVNIQNWFPLGLALISLQSKELWRVFSSTTVCKHLQHSAFFMIQLSHPYVTTGKTIGLTRQNFVSKAMSLLFNTLSRFVIALLPRSKCLLISWLQLPSAVILEPRKIKCLTVSFVSTSTAMKWWDQMSWS